jgi:very-short-patch-repair endonuclease
MNGPRSRPATGIVPGAPKRPVLDLTGPGPGRAQYKKRAPDMRSAAKPKATKHDLGDEFAALWEKLGPKDLPKPIREFVFSQTRKWRFDFAFCPIIHGIGPMLKVYVELEGGIWTRGAHNRGRHFISDCEKYNCATELGWVGLRYTTNCLRDRPMQVIEQIVAVLKARMQ